MSLTYGAGLIRRWTERPVCGGRGAGTDSVMDGGDAGQVLTGVINIQLVVVCLVYDVSEASGIKMIGWRERRRRGMSLCSRSSWTTFKPARASA